MLGWRCSGALLLWIEYLKSFNGLKVDVGSFYDCYTSIPDCLMCFRMRPLLFVESRLFTPHFALWRRGGSGRKGASPPGSIFGGAWIRDDNHFSVLPRI